MEEEEKSIIKRCRECDEKAFEWVYKKYYRLLLGVALRYSRDMMEAEDVLQDSFIKIFYSIETFSMKGSFEGWLKRIVQNTAINSYHKNLKHNLYIDVRDKEDELAEDAFSSVLNQYDVPDIIAMLHGLPEGYRMVINLFYIDGYTHKEIAGMLSISEGTSKSQLFKAKAYLKEMIETNNNKEIL